ncbi:MAG: TolC family protein [Planctomycetes bacterium]|nr:TolC family protein [Planctomycetota bacterium]
MKKNTAICFALLACMLIPAGCSLPVNSPDINMNGILYKDLPLSPAASEQFSGITTAPAEKGTAKYGFGITGQLKEKDTLTLDDCMLIALENSDMLMNQAELLYQSSLNKQRASAALMPQVSLLSRYTQNSDSVSFGSGKSAVEFISDSSFEYWFSMKQPLFVGFRDWVFLKQTKLDIESREDSLVFARDQVLTAVSEAYYAILKADKDVEVTKSSLERAKQQMEKIKAKAEEGEAKKSDLLSAESMVAGLEYAIVRAEYGAKIARERMNLLLGVPVNAKYLKPLPETAVISNDINALITTAIANRQDLKSAEIRIEYAKEGKKIALGEFLPTIMLQWDYNSNRAGYISDLDWQLYISGEMPVFEGGLKKAKVSEAESKIRQAETARNQLVKEIKFDVQRSALELNAVTESLKALQKQVESARATYELVQAEYNEKLSTNLEVLTANEALTNAEAQLEKENLNLEVAILKLKLATGTLSTGNNR